MTVKTSVWITSKPFRGLCLLLAALFLLSTPVSAAEVGDSDQTTVLETAATEPAAAETEAETQPVETTTAEAESTTQAPETTTAELETTTKADTSEADKALDDLQKQYDKIEDELKENEEKLNQVSSEKKEQKKVVKSIYGQIDDTQNQINLLSSRINLLNVDISNTNNQIALITGQFNSLNGQIDAAQSEINDKKIELSETYIKLKKRIRAMYMAGNGSTLEILLTSEDFSTLLTRIELLKRTAQQDNAMMEKLATEINDLENLEDSLNGSMEQVQNKKNQLDNKKTALNHTREDVQSTNTMLAAKQNQIKSQYAQAQQELNSMDKESAEYVALIRQQENQLDAVSKQMEEYIKQNASKSTDPKPTREHVTDANGADLEDDSPAPLPIGSTKMIFPLKCSGVYISSPYGYRTHPVTGQYKLHTGTDFTAGGIYQKPIYAVRDGTVIYAQFQNAYGNFIMIDHGSGVVTCYAHCDSISVVKGDKIVQGQVIGRVGSTGYSTGAHLHFEVRIDGQTTDPMNGYLTLPR